MDGDGGEDTIPAPQTSKAPIRNHAVGTTVCTYLGTYLEVGIFQGGMTNLESTEEGEKGEWQC